MTLITNSETGIVSSSPSDLLIEGGGGGGLEPPSVKEALLFCFNPIFKFLCCGNVGINSGSHAANMHFELLKYCIFY